MGMGEGYAMEGLNEIGEINGKEKNGNFKRPCADPGRNLAVRRHVHVRHVRKGQEGLLTHMTQSRCGGDDWSAFGDLRFPNSSKSR
mmetsp:Transcript_28261/g.45018  ORF Transcript_28261/g.45018 Transcript_28261/m.45018 type:complete len:86 (-) Transcript_28261:71-328(-)